MDYQVVNGETRQIEPAQREPVITFELTCGCETQSMDPEDHKTTCRLRTMLVMDKKPETEVNKVIVTYRPPLEFMRQFDLPPSQKTAEEKGWINPPLPQISRVIE